MSYTWNVVPKTFTDEVGQFRTIVGIQCKLISNIVFDRNEYKPFDLWLAFVQDTGALYGERNVNTSTFEQKMIDGGMPEVQAKGTVKAIMKDLCFGTVVEMEAKAAILAGLYGYQLATASE
jgi:hypothetical protein